MVVVKDNPIVEILVDLLILVYLSMIIMPREMRGKDLA